MVEDKFNGIALDKFRMRRRFKILVERLVVYEIADVLSKKFK